MKQAVIDIGSNSIRLTLYETDKGSFKILFRKKIMAGLAGYVKKGVLSGEGIECACEGLNEFKSILQALHVDNISVFATASLRNISNSEQALETISASTGFFVEILSGEDEALLGYSGAMMDVSVTSGAFFDIGGASTEIVSFDNGNPVDFVSFPVGSLSLYNCCVTKILPGKTSLKRIKKTVSKSIRFKGRNSAARSLVVGVGGTARAALKLARHYYSLPADCSSVTSKQLDELVEFLCSGEKQAVDFILKLAPERIHTLLPGMLILQHVLNVFKTQEFIVSKYGVREGYLCQRILKSNDEVSETDE